MTAHKGGAMMEKTTDTIKKFTRGDKVEVNGNKEARILDYYSDGMVIVRLFSGLRHVGDICIDEKDVRIIP